MRDKNSNISNQSPQCNNQILGVRIFLNYSQHNYKMTGCSPSSSDMTINESVNSRERGSDFGIGLITWKWEKLLVTCSNRLLFKIKLELQAIVIHSCSSSHNLWLLLFLNMLSQKALKMMDSLLLSCKG